MKPNALREWLRTRSQSIQEHPLALPVQEVLLLALADLWPRATQKYQNYWHALLHGVYSAEQARGFTTLLTRDESAAGRLEKLLNTARRRRRAGKPISAKQVVRDLDRWSLCFETGLTFREIAWVERRGGQYGTYSTVIKEVLAHRPRPLRIAPGAESSVRDSVNRTQRLLNPDAPPYRARRRRLEPLPASIPTYQCPEHGAKCGPGCRYMLTWRNQIERFLPTDRSGT